MSTVELTFIDKQGVETAVSAEPGQTLMEVATANNVAGIDGDCGGCCACATCRVLPNPELRPRLPAMQADEQDLLDFVASSDSGVRLGCQINVDASMQGARLQVATD